MEVWFKVEAGRCWSLGCRSAAVGIAGVCQLRVFVGGWRKKGKKKGKLGGQEWERIYVKACLQCLTMSDSMGKVCG